MMCLAKNVKTIQAVRSTKKERNAVKKSWRNARKPQYKLQGNKYEWHDVIAVAKLAKLTLHKDAKSFWDQQNTGARNSRKIQLQDGKKVWLSAILSGGTSGIKTSPEHKNLSITKSKATSASRNHGQTMWIEVAAWTAFFKLIDSQYPNVFEFEPLPDGLTADLLIRRKNCGNMWIPVQVKSCKAYFDEELQFGLTKQDGLSGGRYEKMVVWCLSIDPYCNRPSAEQGFNTVSQVNLRDIFVYGNASEMPGKRLAPYPRIHGKTDAYGLNRYSAGINTDDELNAIIKLAVYHIDNAVKCTRQDAWFRSSINNRLAKLHILEVDNSQSLAQVVKFENMTAPLAQNETVDVILSIGGKSVNVSLKTASLHGKEGYRFVISKAPNAKFCDVVLVFYVNRKTSVRTHVSVLDSKKIYTGDKLKMFCWSNISKKHILKQRISLVKNLLALEQLEQAIELIMT